MEMTCPVDTISLPGLENDLKLSGLIIVVGPNSSGKTQLLRDINAAVTGQSRELVVASGVTYSLPPNFDMYFNRLVDTGSIVDMGENYRVTAFQYGAEHGAGQTIVRGRAEADHKSYVASVAGQRVVAKLEKDKFLSLFGPLSCSALFLHNRLTLMNACENFDHKSNSPTRTLQSIYWDSNAQRKFQEEIASVFNIGVWVDAIGDFRKLTPRVTDGPDIPSAEERTQPDLMEGYREIEDEGDGVRSYAAICATLLLERRPLCLIDEPEMCLHPPQAYAIGRFMGRHVSDATSTVVATHSSHVLRGILESNQYAHVIRLTRDSPIFSAKLLSPDTLNEAISKPRSRSEVILEGLFAQGVVMCESEGDRIVYESAYRTLRSKKLDIRFVPSEGTGGFAEPLRLYRSLGVPSAIIADLDFLYKESELKQVLSALSEDDDLANRLVAEAKLLIGYVRLSAKVMPQSEVKVELESVIRDLCNIDNDVVRKKLASLASKMYRLRDLKDSGVAGISETWSSGKIGEGDVKLRIRIENLLSEMKVVGLFLVPVGELESWLPIVMKGVARQDKSRWAIHAAEKIEDNGERDDDVWAFISEVSQYLQS